MYLTAKQQVKHLSKTDYLTLKQLCHVAKNLANEAIYNIRQHWFTEGSYLRYESNYALLKDSPNYRLLNSNMAQQIIRTVDSMFKGFFALLKLAKQGKYPMQSVKLPHYLPKDGFMTLIIAMVRLKDNSLTIPFSNTFRKEHNPILIKLPPTLHDKYIKQINIIPRSNGRFFEIQYIYKAETVQRNLDTNTALSLDFGINNLVTAVTNTGKSFIIDGKRLKSINQWFNKQNAKLQSVKDKQGYLKRTTNKQKRLAFKRNNRVNDYMSKTARFIVDYCVANNIGVLVVGYNATFQKNSSIGKRNNQNFVNIPFGRLKDKLRYLAELNGILFIEQEESYTSKASFWDNDTIPDYNTDNPQTYNFSGRRVSRGLYRTFNGTLLNADVNGALNILKKSNVVSLIALYNRGEVDTPIRIRVA